MRTSQNPETFKRLVALETDDCVIWPHGTDGKGYGKLKHNGRLVGTHRLACLQRNGPPPSPEHQAAHSCRNRNCMNYRHLRWATSYENSEDRWIDGTNTVGEDTCSAKLTNEAVAHIRSPENRNVRSGVFARQYGVTVNTISNARYGRTWRHVPM